MSTANEAVDVPIRLVCIGTTYGFIPELFFPKQTGHAYELPLLLQPLLYYDDSTRVVTLEFSELGANLGGLPISRGYYQLTHHGKVESYIEELSIVEIFYMTQFARFLDLLRAVVETNGKTMLVNTITLIGSGMGNASSHSNRSKK